jgi:aminopeptidase N
VKLNETLNVISSMPLLFVSNDTVGSTFYFQTTPKIFTSSFGFTIGDFNKISKIVNGMEFNVYAQNYTNYEYSFDILNSTVETTLYLSSFIGNYTTKVDIVFLEL